MPWGLLTLLLGSVFEGFGPALRNKLTMSMFAGSTTILLVIAIDICFTEKLTGPTRSSVPVDDVLSVWKNIALANIVVNIMVKQHDNR